MNHEISLFKFQIVSFIITVALGVLLHFTYDFLDQNPIVGIFSAINESTWEHLKLLYYPMLISSVLGYLFFYKKYPNYICIRTISMLFSMIFTVIFFYTYTGILGRNIAFVDISSFFISVLISEYITNTLAKFNFKCNKKIAIIVLFSLFIFFAIFTFNPPNIGLFEDPLTGTFGIPRNIDFIS